MKRYVVLCNTCICGRYGNRNSMETEAIVNFEVIFGYHGNQVAKSTSSSTPSHRTQRMCQFDMSLVFLSCILRKKRPKYGYFQNSLILGGCHGNQVMQLSSPCLPWTQHPTPDRAHCKLFPFQKNGLIMCCTSEAIFTHLYRLSISKGLNTIEIVVVDYANDLPVGRLISQAPL